MINEWRSGWKIGVNEEYLLGSIAAGATFPIHGYLEDIGKDELFWIPGKDRLPRSDCATTMTSRADESIDRRSHNSI